MLCLPGDQSHPFAQPTINPLACCICWAGLLGHAVFPPWNEGPNSGSYNSRYLLTSYFCIDEKDIFGVSSKTLKDELPRSVGDQYITGEEWRNDFRKNEEMEPKQKQCPVVDVTGDGSKVQSCKEQ